VARATSPVLGLIQNADYGAEPPVLSLQQPRLLRQLRPHRVTWKCAASLHMPALAPVLLGDLHLYATNLAAATAEEIWRGKMFDAKTNPDLT
jgi:hypothetical protein